MPPQKDVRETVLELLQNFRGVEPLKRLFWMTLNYERENDQLSRHRWPESTSKLLAEDPVLLASAGYDHSFHVVYSRLADPELRIGHERRVVDELSKDHRQTMYVFSNRDQNLWHFVNVPYGDDPAGRRVYRRITVGDRERFRTATDRISMLDLESLAATLKKDVDDLSVMDIQSRHDEAFSVEKVTDQFFRKYREVFEYVEARVQGIDDLEDRRLFVQRLFNRMMFIAFVEKKGWLKLDSRTDYLPALWKTYQRNRSSEEGFYKDRLKRLFFSGFNAFEDHRGPNPLIGQVPYLNGGLFEEDKYDLNSRIDMPDECFALILKELFGGFNFTTTESTPLDVEVAVDPEMLGRVFEELVTGRHETGSYYTPKPIVSFMCREAIKGHLESRLPNDEPEAIRRFVEDHDPEGLKAPESMLDALREVKVCDPACGSGAYLLGMLRELVDLRESLFRVKKMDAPTDYERKLEIIQNNIYGVDIDNFAVNIARLRLWLSLMVDFDGENPPPLPNLDFKIEVGDSLTAPGPSAESSVGFRQSQIDEYFDLKAAYLNAHGEEKNSLRSQIDLLKGRIKEWSHAEGDIDGFDWPVEFAEVFVEGGFDVVLTNPPYVRQELITSLKPQLKRRYPEVYKGTADLYVYFYARAAGLLREDGVLVYISPNRWFRAGYGDKLRQFFADNFAVRTMVDFGGAPVFQSVATFAMIFIAQKAAPRDTPPLFAQLTSLEPPYPDLAALVRDRGYRLGDGAIEGSSWSLMDVKTSDRLRRMKSGSTFLGKYVGERIYWGVKTGYNKAFVIDGQKRSELIADDPLSAEIIRPLVVGDDVRKWHIRAKDRWLIFARHGINIRRYRAIHEHLSQWRTELTPKKNSKEKVGRKPGSYKWYEIQDNVAFHDAFDEPKIVYPEICKEPRFAFDRSGTITNNKTFVIPSEDLFLLGVLNAATTWEFVINTCSQLLGQSYELRSAHLSQLPIPVPSTTDREQISALVKHCLEIADGGTEELDREIDERVAFLYGLSIKDLTEMQRLHFEQRAGIS